MAILAAALGLGLAASPASLGSERLLVSVEDSSASDARLAHALDAQEVERLPAGWRAVTLDRPLTLTQARSRVDSLPGRVRVDADPMLRAAVVPNDPLFAPGSGDYQWALRNTGDAAGSVAGADIDAEAGWDAATSGGQVIVAVIDTGVQADHPDLASRMWVNPGEIAGNGVDDDGNGRIDDVNGWDFRNGDASVYDGSSDYHGTHVAGTIGAAWGNGIGVAGVAPNARLMSLKFIGPWGGYTSDAVAAIEYAVAGGARVMNMSFGGSGYSEALCDAIEWAAGQGVVSVVAAGNESADNDAVPSWPANCPEASLLSVASTTDADALSSFSNFGASSVDLGAPGSRVLSTLPGGGYGVLSGTSMATPHVAGIAAAVLGERPTIAPWEVSAAIRGGGDPLSALAGRTVSGRRASLRGALSLAVSGTVDGVPPSAPTPASPGDGAIVTEPRPTLAWIAASDAESGVQRYDLVVDGATHVSVGASTTSARPAVDLGPGTHAWSVVAVDRVGNRAESVRRSFTIPGSQSTEPAQPSAPAEPVQTVGLSVANRIRVGARPTLRVTSDRAAGATISVRRGTSTIGRFTLKVVEGTRTVRLPVRIARRLRTGRYVFALRVGSATSEQEVRVGTLRALRARPQLRVPRVVRRGVRPGVRVRAVPSGRAVITVRRGARTIGRVRLTVGPRWRLVRTPAPIARRLRPGTHVVELSAGGIVTRRTMRVAARTR